MQSVKDFKVRQLVFTEEDHNQYLTENYGDTAKPFIEWRSSLSQQQKEQLTPRMVEDLIRYHQHGLDLSVCTQTILPKGFDTAGLMEKVQEHSTTQGVAHVNQNMLKMRAGYGSDDGLNVTRKIAMPKS